MEVTRLYTGDDGESHFETVHIPLEDHGDIGKLSQAENVQEIMFRETPPDYDFHWHNAPCRQYVIMLEGQVEIEIGSGTTRVLKSGDILLAEDTTGRGHISRAIDNKTRKSIFVTLA